mmetsp:Transcript_2253/g.4846  ORF Transcript_2253/g.4846 Transcript_2253/m.4846 type:complete len:460 (-) Transcript_2253:80-1459(-)
MTSRSSKLQLQTTLVEPSLSSSPAWQITLTIDGKYLAVCFGNPDTCVKIWESLPCSSLDANPDVHKSSSSNSSYEWKLLTTIQEGHSRTIRSLSFAPISNGILGKDSPPILATASFDGKVMIWEYYEDESESDNNYVQDSKNESERGILKRGAYECTSQLEGHENEVKCLAWNATGSLLASCGRDKTIWIWECFLPGTIGGESNVPSSEEEGEFECLSVLQGHDGDIKYIVFAPSNGIWGEGEEILLSAGYDNSIKVWAEEGDGDWYCAATLGVGDGPLPSLGEAGGSNKGDVHSSTVWCLGVAPGGVRFLSGSEDGSVAIWKCYTANERKRLFPNERAVSSTDGLWSCVGVLPNAHSGYAILSIDCAPSRAGHGRIVSGGGDNSIHIYREEMPCEDSKESNGSGMNFASIGPKFAYDAVAVDAHTGDVNCVKWHPKDGRCLISAGDDGAVKVWKYTRE